MNTSAHAGLGPIGLGLALVLLAPVGARAQEAEGVAPTSSSFAYSPASALAPVDPEARASEPSSPRGDDAAWVLSASDAELEAALGPAWERVGIGVGVLLGGVALGAIAIPVGIASEVRETRCISSGSGWGGWGGGGCSDRSVIVRYDSGLLGLTVFLAVTGALAILVGGFGFIMPGNQRTRALRRELRTRERAPSVSLAPLESGGLLTLSGEF